MSELSEVLERGIVINIFGMFYMGSFWVVYSTTKENTILIALSENFDIPTHPRVAILDLANINYYVLNQKINIDADYSSIIKKYSKPKVSTGDIIKIEISKDTWYALYVKYYNEVNNSHTVVDLNTTPTNVCVVNLCLCNYVVILNNNIKLDIQRATKSIKQMLKLNSFINLRQIDTNTYMKLFNNYIIDSTHIEHSINTLADKIEPNIIDNYDKIVKRNNILVTDYSDITYVNNILTTNNYKRELRMSKYDNVTEDEILNCSADKTSGNYCILM
jgi:hypothetical protein